MSTPTKIKAEKISVYKEADIREELFWYIRKNFRSQADAAEKLQIPPVTLSAMVTGRLPISSNVLYEMGYARKVVYVKI